MGKKKKLVEDDCLKEVEVWAGAVGGRRRRWVEQSPVFVVVVMTYSTTWPCICIVLVRIKTIYEIMFIVLFCLADSQTRILHADQDAFGHLGFEKSFCHKAANSHGCFLPLCQNPRDAQAAGRVLFPKPHLLTQPATWENPSGMHICVGMCVYRSRCWVRGQLGKTKNQNLRQGNQVEMFLDCWHPWVTFARLCF